MIEDAEVSEYAKEDAAERGDDLGAAEPMWPLERIEPFIRALDERRPIPLAFSYDSMIAYYDFCGPKELSDREREAVSLYAERPYKPQWRGDDSCPPDKILLEIERKLGPAESEPWWPKKQSKDSLASCGVNDVRKVVAMPFLVVGAIFDAVGEKILGE